LTHLHIYTHTNLQNNDNFEEGLLKLVRTLPKVLKFLPSDKAQDARNFVQSLQYWLGGNADNLENLLISTAQVCGCGYEGVRDSALCHYRPSRPYTDAPLIVELAETCEALPHWVRTQWPPPQRAM